MVDNNDLEFVMDRTFDAPIHLVWKAWTDPDQLKPGQRLAGTNASANSPTCSP